MRKRTNVALTDMMDPGRLFRQYERPFLDNPVLLSAVQAGGEGTTGRPPILKIDTTARDARRHDKEVRALLLSK